MTAKKTTDLEGLDSVSKRLKYMVDTLGVKQSHMAEKLGISPAGLHNILNNDIKFSKNAKKIAEYFNVNQQWLATGEGDIHTENNSIKTYKVSVYYPDQLKLYYCSNQKTIINTSDYVVTTTAYENKTIGIYIIETQFSPKFEVGDMVVFEQSDDFKDGEILIVYLKKHNAITLGHGFHLGGDIVLISQDEGTTKLEQKNGDVLIGSYRECFKKSKFI